jgi:TonB family protein
MPMNTPYWFTNLAYWSAQVALLTLAAGFLPHLFKIRQPRVLLIYWRALIAVCLLLPFAQPWHRPENVGVINLAPRFSEVSPIVLATPTPPVTHWHLPSASVIAQIVGLIILAGIVARFTILALGLLKLRQFRRASSPILDHSPSSAVLDEMRVRVNTGGEFRISSDVDSPVTFGLSAPVILLPERFPTLDAQYQSAIACHELIHVRRCDWAHHLSEEILRAVLWFHPAIVWLIARIRLSREQVVDLEVLKLTEARKPYLEALLEFTNRRALAAAIPAPPFLVERQLAERVALMLKEVRMSRTRLIASLTAIAACLAIVATLAVWTFPLKASPRISLPPIQSTDKGVVQFVSGGINGGVTGGVTQGVSSGVVVGATIGGVTKVTINGVPGGVVGGVKNGVPGGIVGGITNADAVSPQREDTSPETVALVSTKRVPPVYPQDAIENHLQGRVNLTLTINAAGRVSDVEFINGSTEFVQSATDAVFQWEFQPPAKSPAIMMASFYFTLSPNRPHAPFVEAPEDPRAVSSFSVEVTAQDPSPQSPATPAVTNDSRFIGKFQFIPPATVSSRNFQPIPTVVESSPRALIVHPGDPPTPTNRGIFQTVSPPEPAVSRNPISQSTTGQVARAGENGINMPVCRYCPKPEYSQEARDAKIQGTVYKQAIKVVRERWTFKPATDRTGDLVDAFVPVDIAFQLDPNANGVSMPVCEYCPRPDYSSEAKKARVTGTVYLQVTVLPNGRAGEITLTKGIGMGLDEKAIETVKKKWKFKPAIGSNGKPVITMVPVEIKFEI